MSAQIRNLGRLTFDRCAQLLGDKTVKKIGPNTWVARQSYMGGPDRTPLGDGFVVTFHGTDIIKLTPAGGVYLFAGGYRTATTKGRLSELSGYTVSQRSHVWYVDGREFYEGINVGLPASEVEAVRKDAERGDPVAQAALKDLALERA